MNKYVDTDSAELAGRGTFKQQIRITAVCADLVLNGRNLYSILKHRVVLQRNRREKHLDIDVSSLIRFFWTMPMYRCVHIESLSSAEDHVWTKLQLRAEEPEALLHLHLSASSTK